MGEQKNKRQRFSHNGEGSGGKKSSVAALARSPAATVAQAALAPRPVAMAKPAATVSETTPLAVMPPTPASPTVADLAAPSSAALATQDATVEDLVVTSPVAAMAPAPAAPIPVAIAKPERVVKPEEQGAEVAEQELGPMAEEEKEAVKRAVFPSASYTVPHITVVQSELCCMWMCARYNSFYKDCRPT